MKSFVWAAFAVVFSVVALASNTAKSAVIINFLEVGGNVTMDLSGSLDVSALGTPSTGFIGLQNIVPTSSIVAVGAGVNTDQYSSIGLTGPAYGPGFFETADTWSGDAFFMNAGVDVLGLPVGYVSGTPLSSNMTFFGQDFSILGLTPGSYLYTFPGDTIIINVGPVSVPAPAGLPLMVMGLGAVALLRQRRKKTASV